MRFIPLFFLFFCVKTSTVWAQDQATKDQIQALNEQRKYSEVENILESQLKKGIYNEYLVDEMAYNKSKRYSNEDAYQYIVKQVPKFPKNENIYFCAGQWSYFSGHFKESVEFYNLAYKYAKSDSLREWILINRSSSKHFYNDTLGAIEDLKLILSKNPTNKDALSNLAMVYDQTHQFDKSIATLKQALQMDSTYFPAMTNLGFVYGKIDSLPQSLYYFNKAITLNSEEPTLYNNRGYTYYRMGNYPKALEDIQLSLKMYPQNSYAYRNLALVYLAQKQNNEACTALQYARAYGFVDLYGNEVEELIAQNCPQLNQK